MILVSESLVAASNQSSQLTAGSAGPAEFGVIRSCGACNVTRIDIVLALVLLAAIFACTILLWVRTNRATRYLNERHPDLGPTAALGVPLFGSLMLRRLLSDANHPATRDEKYVKLQREVWQAWVAERVLLAIAIGVGFYGAYVGR